MWILNLDHYITHPFYKCRVTFRPVTGVGRKTMCYITTTKPHNKIMLVIINLYEIGLNKFLIGFYLKNTFLLILENNTKIIMFPHSDFRKD